MMKTFAKFPLAFAALVALVALAACGGGEAKRTGSVTTPSASAVPDAAATPSVDASANPIPDDATPSPSASPKGKTPGPCQAYSVYSRNAGAPGAAYIQAVPRNQRRWGPDCETLNAGDACGVGWQVAYTIADPQGAHVVFQVWARGRAEPVVNERVGPIPSQGQAKNWVFPMQVPETKEIAMRLVLEDSRKIPVLVSDTYVYRVDCVAPIPS